MDTAFKTQMAPSLALLTLGALTPLAHRVTMEDENVERLNLVDRPDLVGITVKADTAYRSWRIAESYRKRGIPVVLGGIHPTVVPEENLAYADSIVIGEAEEIWEGLFRDAEQGILKKVYQQDHPSDLSRSPVPRWELAKGKNYLFVNTLTSGRGCPWSCDFCYSSSPNLFRGHRAKPAGRVMEEIESLGVKHVFFIDDNFIGSPERARELMRAMSPLGLTWHCAVSADIGRYDDLLDLMAESGCQSLFIGFETINAVNLASCHKKQNRVAEYNSTIRKIHERGMMVNASLALGFDSDRPRVFLNTLNWLLEQKIETMTAHILTPYPGTRLYQRLLNENRIIDFNLNHYNTSRAVFQPRQMTAKELEQGYRWLYQGFYSLAGIIERMPAASSQWTAYLLFNFFYRKFGSAFSLLGKLGLMPVLGNLGKALSYPATWRNDPGKDYGLAARCWIRNSDSSSETLSNNSPV